MVNGKYGIGTPIKLFGFFASIQCDFKFDGFEFANFVDVEQINTGDTHCGIGVNALK